MGVECVQMSFVRLTCHPLGHPSAETNWLLLLQRESKNLSTHEANTFEHVYLFQEMRVPSARRIRECETLLNGMDESMHP
jgi:hypothetical protein